MRDGPRILVLDIETAPNLAYVWGLWDQRVGLNQLVEASSVLCFAAKWHGKPKVHYASDHHDGHAEMVKAAHALIDEADAIVHYNGRAFDLKHLRREFLLAGLGPTSPHKDIDLLTVVRSKFKFARNKLAHVSVELGLEGKAETGGFDLWRDCMAGDDKAWATMKRYNVQDVRLTEELYDKLVPWIDNHPHWALHATPQFEGDDCCQRCGSKDLMRRGHYRTNVGKYRLFQCKDCKGYTRGRQRVGTVDARGVA
jgi:DNA polymerase elongation subunit (family B)